MIRVKRPPIPEEFKEPFEKERLATITHYEIGACSGTFKFQAYKTKGVADALNVMFHGKCAYCESRMLAVQPTDIEHFRPKAKVDGDPRSRGYYWLATNWENLLASCIFCNRRNSHWLPNEESKRTQGKASQFPLKKESKRALRSNDSHANETQLVLDPCGTDDPRDHLSFEDDGQVKPRKRRGGHVSEFGLTTIEVLALQRMGLVKERREYAIRILGDLGLIQDLSSEAEANPQARYKQGQRLELLAEYLQPPRPYIALAKDIIDRHQPGLLDDLPQILTHFRGLKTPKPRKSAGNLTRRFRELTTDVADVHPR